METALMIIEPVKELVAGHSVKVQVKLDEDATDQQILSALDDACRAWSTSIVTGAALQHLVGKILVAVKAREIHKREQWGTFEAFLEKEIQPRYGIDPRTAYQAIELVTGIPDLSPQQARIPAAKLLPVAQAVNQARPQNKKLIRDRWLKEAANKTERADEFRDRLKSAKLLRTSNRKSTLRLANISFRVSSAIAHAWIQYCGSRQQALVFAEWVEEKTGMRRKQAGKARIGRVESNGHRAMA